MAATSARRRDPARAGPGAESTRRDAGGSGRACSRFGDGIISVYYVMLCDDSFRAGWTDAEPPSLERGATVFRDVLAARCQPCTPHQDVHVITGRTPPKHWRARVPARLVAPYL